MTFNKNLYSYPTPYLLLLVTQILGDVAGRDEDTQGRHGVGGESRGFEPGRYDSRLALPPPELARIHGKVRMRTAIDTVTLCNNKRSIIFIQRSILMHWRYGVVRRGGIG